MQRLERAGAAASSKAARKQGSALSQGRTFMAGVAWRIALRCRESILTFLGQGLRPRLHGAALGPGVVKRLHIPNPVRHSRRQVVELGSVFVQIVQLPVFAVLRNQFPVALANGAVAFVFPE